MLNANRSSTSGNRRQSTTSRILVLCLCLALALIAANLIYSALMQPTEVLAGADGDLLYVAAFSNFNDDWDLFTGQQSAQINLEQMQISVEGSQTAAWSTARPRFSNFDVSIKAVAHDGPVDNAFGIVFHVDDLTESACTLPAVVLCGISELVPLAGAVLRQAFDQSQTTNYTAFLISSDGYYSLWRKEDGRNKALSAWIASPRINQGTGSENTIRVMADSGVYQFFINDTLIELCIPDETSAESTYAGGECIDGSMQDTYYDKMGRTGRLGVIAQSTATGGGGVVVRFDDMIVYSPAETKSEDARL